MSAGTTSAAQSGVREALIEERDFLLRSLRDLDAERDAGEITPGDYSSLRDGYIRRAAEVARRLERVERGEPAGQVLPPAGRTDRGGAAGAGAAGAGAAGAERPEAVKGAEPGLHRAGGPSARRRLRRSLTALGVLLCVGGAGWAAAAATGTQLPGGFITGDAIGPQKVAEDLLAAAKASASGQPVRALRDYQAVLDVQPGNPTALTGEAAVLLESNQANLVGRSAVMLAKAEQADPSYAPAYIYLGRALTVLGDYSAAEKQLRTFITDYPKGTAATEARKLLAYAAKRASGTGKGSGSSGG